MKGEWALVANPEAGRGRGRHVSEQAAAALRAQGQPVSVHLTSGPGEAAALAADLVARGCRRLLTCGGDGTLNQVLPAVVETEVEVGVIPCGTGNDFCRALRIPGELPGAIRALLAGRVQRLDVGRAIPLGSARGGGGDSRLFCTVAACGFDAQVSQAVNDRRDGAGLFGRTLVGGTLSYLLAGLGRLAGYRPVEMRLTGEFGERHGRYLLVATGNTCSYGGGMRIAPAADPRDGLFDICIVEALPRATLLRILPRLFGGRHIYHPAVRIERSSWLRIEPREPQLLHVDGESAGCAPAAIECLPQALSVVVAA